MGLKAKKLVEKGWAKNAPPPRLILLWKYPAICRVKLGIFEKSWKFFEKSWEFFDKKWDIFEKSYKYFEKSWEFIFEKKIKNGLGLPLI